MNRIVNYGDIAAIPFFGLLTYYFLVKKNRTTLENILLLFAISGFLFDVYFTYIYFL